MSISTAYAGKQPHFPGVHGYRPLPPLTAEEIAKLPYHVLVAEIRHYMTIVEQKQEWLRNKERQKTILKGLQNACVQPQRTTRGH